MRVAFLQDLSVPSHVDLVSPSFLSFDLALHRSIEEDGVGVALEVVQMDTEGDAELAVELAEEAAADPSYVAAVVAPFWAEPPEVAQILSDAGVPTFSLSPQSPAPASVARGLWRRFVPDASLQVSALADAVDEAVSSASRAGPAEPVCIAAEDWATSIEVQRDLDETLAPDIERVTLNAGDEGALEDAGQRCGSIVWTGAPEGATDLEEALHDAGMANPVVDLATDAMKAVIPPTVPTHEGVVPKATACPCVDVTTWRADDVRGFVNAYQAANGLPPGIYAAEAWDAANVLAKFLAGGARDRDAVTAGLSALEATDGVAREYVFDDAGELVDPSVELFRAAGSRWLRIAS